MFPRGLFCRQNNNDLSAELYTIYTVIPETVVLLYGYGAGDWRKIAVRRNLQQNNKLNAIVMYEWYDATGCKTFAKINYFQTSL